MDMGQKQYVTDIVLTAPLHAVNTSASIAKVHMARPHSIAVIGGDGAGGGGKGEGGDYCGLYKGREFHGDWRR